VTGTLASIESIWHPGLTESAYFGLLRLMFGPVERTASGVVELTLDDPERTTTTPAERQSNEPR